MRGNLRLVVILQLLFAVLFTLAMLYPNLFSKWGLIDDHEIIINLGADNEMSLAEFPSKLLQTEVGFAKEGRSRYRPAYWTAHLLETVAWGGQPLRWYTFRLFMIAISIFIAWYLLSKYLGHIFSGITCLFLFTQSYWADIWTRLGPAELYAMFGLAVYSLAFYKIWTGKRNVWWVLLALGAFLAYGSKENFLFLLPVTAGLVFKGWKNKTLSAVPITCALFIFLSGFAITGIIVYLLSKTGADIYGNSVNPMNRFFYRLLEYQNVNAFVPLFVSAILYTASKRAPENQCPGFSPSSSLKYKNLLLIQLLLFAVWTTQFFFYYGELPLNTRYDFPGIFIYNLSMFFLLYVPFKIIGTNRVLRGIVLTGFAAYIFHIYALKGFIFIQGTSVDNLKKTSQFTQNAVRVITALKENPAVPVIFDSHTYSDAEPMVSFSRYLFTYGVSNPAAIFFDERAKTHRSDNLSRILTKQLLRISQNGDDSTAEDRLRFHSYSSIPQGNCFVVSFSGDSTLDCFNLGKVW